MVGITRLIRQRLGTLLGHEGNPSRHMGDRPLEIGRAPG
jgi:hypothetical protein